MSASVALAAAGCGGSSSKPTKLAAPAKLSAESRFSATIRRGPDSGLAVAGTLTGKLTSSGRIVAAVVGDRQRIPVSGEVKGRTATLVFHLPGNRIVAGVGTARRHVDMFSNLPPRGSFTGPSRGDRGDWFVEPASCVGSPGAQKSFDRVCTYSDGRVYSFKCTYDPDVATHYSCVKTGELEPVKPPQQ